jgi:hypothetical protein
MTLVLRQLHMRYIQKNTQESVFLWWSDGACFLTLKSGGCPFQALLKSRRVEVSAVLVTTSSRNVL